MWLMDDQLQSLNCTVAAQLSLLSHTVGAATRCSKRTHGKNGGNMRAEHAELPGDASCDWWSPRLPFRYRCPMKAYLLHG